MDLAALRQLDAGGWGYGALHDAGLTDLGTAPSTEASVVRAARDALAAILHDGLGAGRVTVRDIRPLAGGAIHAHQAISIEAEGGRVPGHSDWVLRTDADPGFRIGHPPAVEAALLTHAAAAGVPVPEVLTLGQGAPGAPAPLDRPFLILRRVAGDASVDRLVALDAASGAGIACAAGRVLARIHAVQPAPGAIAGLSASPEDPAAARVADLRAALLDMQVEDPVLNHALDWLDRNRPAPAPARLIHGDFRSGNLMIAGRDADVDLAAVLDWEFARWSDPHEDLGWLTAPCWRFTRRDRPVGGFAAPADLMAGYVDEGGGAIESTRLHYWQVFAQARWAVIALRQATRFDPRDLASLDCGLTGWRLPELCHEILRLTGTGETSRPTPVGPAIPLPIPVPAPETLLQAVARGLAARGAGGATSDGEGRMLGLMINALGIAERALAQGASGAAGPRTLGEMTRARLAVSNPRYLKASDGALL